MLSDIPRRGGRLPSILFGTLVLGVAALATASCNLDPVQRAGVNGLGPERDDLYPPESEYHRPGEPCVLCHSDKGPASDSPYVIGGTIFWGPERYDRRVDRAYVRIKDSNRTTKCFVTNCNGNFFVRPDQFPGLRFPILVSVERVVDPNDVRSPSLQLRDMGGHIGREGSCATCHIQGLRDFGSPGQIRLFDSEEQVNQANVLREPLPPCPSPDEPPRIKCPEDRE